MFVSCSGDDVAELLDLSAEQWTDLENLVRPVGRVVYELVSIIMGSATLMAESSENGATTLSRLSFSGYMAHVTILS